MICIENPKIRFKGFTKDWEQRKFGSLLEETRNKTIFEDEDTLLSCAIDGMYLNSELFSHFRGSSNIGYLKVKKNDLILSAQNLHLGNCNVNLRFEHGIISPAYKVYELVGCNPLFMQAWVKKDSTKDFFLKSSTEGASVCRKNIVWEELYKQELPVPSIEEQTKVGEYFYSLDHLITLHQRKCEQTKNLKKYMLQKMFPQNGAKVPEIRFNGFTHDWEQRKLGDDLVSIHTGTNLLGSITNTGMPLIKMGNIQRGYFDTSKVEFLAENEQPDKADIVNYGDFFFNTRNTLELVGKGATWMKNSGEYAFNSNIARFELRNLDTIFFNYLYNTDYMTKQIHARAMGTTSVAAIYPRTLDSVEYLAPCMKEQQKIGAYFKQLDHLITLHQRKCDELKKMKKFMLQNMFI